MRPSLSRSESRGNTPPGAQAGSRLFYLPRYFDLLDQLEAEPPLE
jgi:hypothetical protein